MNIGIVGIPQVGKSTLFRLLTEVESECGKGRASIGVAKVPDARVDYLAGFFQPRKTTYAHINVIDIPGLEPGRSAEFLSALRDVDALVVVVRTFTAAHVPMWRDEPLHPLAEVQKVDEELTITDWSLIDTRLSRLHKSSRQGQAVTETALLEKLALALEDTKPIRSCSLSDVERQRLQGMTFYSSKPIIVVVNTDEEQLRSSDFPGKSELAGWCSERDVPLVEVCAALETEISELEPADRTVFLRDLGVTETGLTRVARAAYECLGLISFFTVGEDEVKAWTIRRGDTAKQAARKIHSDIERGFIRAEVIAYDTFVAHHGSQLRANGAIRLEGRDYVVQDGDIINFRFNV